MIKIENIQVVGFEPAIRGMRNPMNSWEKSDSIFAEVGRDDVHDLIGNHVGFGPLSDVGDDIGPNDHDLMIRLAKQGSVYSKFRRMIVAYMDITAPLYWWKEFDTYKVGTVANSCSTMHKIHSKEFTLDDFSHEHLFGFFNEEDHDCWTVDINSISDLESADILDLTINMLNKARALYLEYQKKAGSGNEFAKAHVKEYWWQMIQLLPSSYNQRRTVMVSYEVLANICQYRGTHKLDEWREFCRVIDDLPYSEIITCGLGDEDDT